jgi:hypothetical protein
MKFLRFVLFLSALAMAPLTPAGSQIVPAPARGPSHSVLLAQAQPAPPVWGFGRLMPQGTVLPRDRERPPAVIGFYFRMTPPDDWVVTWSHNVQASAQPLTQEIGTRARGERLLFFKIDPCAVTGLDTPGTEIPITYEFVFSASQPQGKWTPPAGKGSFILKLDRDTVPPSISSLRAPATVYRGETVQIEISASDVSEEMGGNLVWDSGLRVFRLEGPANPNQAGLQTHVVDDSVPTTCGEKVKTADHSFSYTVPHSAQPGDEIKLRAEVEDWSGNKSGREVVLKVAERCVGGARWVGSISGIHKISGHQAERSAESVRLCEGPLEPVGHLVKGQVHTITLRNDGSTITYVHSEAGHKTCRISGGGTSPMITTVGTISSTLEEIDRNGELRWSRPTYWLSAAPQGTHFYTETCQYGTGTQTNTYSFDNGGWPINIGNDSDDPQAGNRKLEGGRMAGSYATPEGITATWNLTRQGGAPLFPARRNAR